MGGLKKASGAKRQAAVLLMLCGGSAFGQNWPSFRGPGAEGIAERASTPTSWDIETGRNVAWKLDVPGLSHSSPIVWSDRIYLVTAISSDPNSVLQFPLKGALDTRTDMAKHEFRLMAIDKASGKIIWNKLVYSGEPKLSRHPHNSYAAATPATDGKHVVVFFGSEGLYTFDTDGNLLWQQDLGVLDQAAFDLPEYKWGAASSPVIYKNLVVVQCDQIHGSFLSAFDIGTGKQVWRVERDTIPSWSTPGIYEGKTGDQVIANGAESIRAYDPLTGKELWRIRGTSMISVPTPFVAHDLIFCFTGYSRYIQPIYVVRPGSRGDITPPKDATSSANVAWTMQKGAPYLPTPIVYGDYLYIVLGNGIVTCYRAETGEKVWSQRLGNGGTFTSSPVAAGGKLYFANEDGDVYVLKAGAVYEQLAQNHLGEVQMATAAITGDMILYRTQHHLIALKGK